MSTENHPDIFPSIYLAEIGINSMNDLYNQAHEKDVDLGKLEIAKLTVKQMNTLMGLNYNQNYLFYINEESHLIMTTSFRDQRNQRDSKFKNHWITMHIDFIFGRIDGTQE